MKLTRPIHDLWKTLEQETIDQAPIAGVLPLQKNELDHPFNDQINDEQCYFCHLDDLLMV